MKKTKLCEYHLANCEKTAQFQHFKTLGGIKLTKGKWACGNCKNLIKNQPNYE